MEKKLTATQRDHLDTLRTLESANGIGRFQKMSASMQTLEKLGLVESQIQGAPVNKGGGWKIRAYRLTPAGRLALESK
jgi:hypothetical protein